MLRPTNPRCPSAAGCAAAFLAAALLGPTPADADVLSLYAAVQGGGAGGAGVDGEARDEAFHPGVQGLAYGALVGVELLFVDGWIEHTQHMRGGELAGTWTQFMVGLDTQIDIGDPETTPPGQPAEQAAQAQTDARAAAATTPAGAAAGHAGGEQTAHAQQPAPAPSGPAQPAARPRPIPGTAPGYLDIGFAAGFGVGTGQQVMPPLDNSQVTDKGFLGQVHLGLGYRLTRALSLGVRVPVQAAYLFKSGDGAAANDRGNQYVSVNAALLLELRLSLSLR